MGIQDYFRMKNLFGGDNSIGAESPLESHPFSMFSGAQPDINPGTAMPDMDSGDNGDVGPQMDPSSALELFKQSVLNPPQHERPSIMRMIGTGLLSGLQGTGEGQTKPMYDATGKKTGERPMSGWESFGSKPFNVEQTGKILDIPYQKKLDDWKLKTGGLNEAAKLETSLTKQEALDAQRRANTAAIPARVDQGQQKIDTTRDQGQQRIDIEKKKLDLNDWKTKNPQGKIYAPKGGNVVLINPLTGEPTDTGIPTGTLTDKERIELTGAQRIEQIGATGAEQRKTLEEKQIGDLENIGARGEEARKTKGIASPGSSATSQLPTQQVKAQQLKANQAIRDNPEWKSYISTNADGMVEVLPPADGYFSRGPDKATYDAIVKYLNAGSTPTVTTKSAKATTEAGTVKVADAQGNVIGTIPAADVAKLNKAKYHVVQ